MAASMLARLVAMGTPKRARLAWIAFGVWIVVLYVAGFAGAIRDAEVLEAEASDPDAVIALADGLDDDGSSRLRRSYALDLISPLIYVPALVWKGRTFGRSVAGIATTVGAPLMGLVDWIETGLALGIVNGARGAIVAMFSVTVIVAVVMSAFTFGGLLAGLLSQWRRARTARDAS